MSCLNAASMTIGISMDQEICLVLGQVSLSLLYGMRNLQTDLCGPERDWRNGKWHPGQIIYGQNSGRNWKEMQSWGRSRNGQWKNQSSIMLEDYEEFILLTTLRTRISKKPLGMLEKNWKNQWLPLCLAKLWRRIVGMVDPTKLKQDLRQLLYSDLDACELGVRDETTRTLVRIEVTFMINSESLHKILNMHCSHHTEHTWWKETHADTHPVELRRRVVHQILKVERWKLAQHVLQPATLVQALTAEAKNSSERDEAILSAMPSSERRKLELSIRKLHHNCGHPPIPVLVRMLRWKGAKENVLAAARLLRCGACKEAKPPGAQPVSASHEHREPLTAVGGDLAEWNHPVSETQKSAPVVLV